MNIFKQASREKIRFSSDRGELTVEQLWDLPLESRTKVSLNDIAVTVDGNIEGTKDFIGNKTKKNKNEELKLSIVLEIIDIKKKELKAKAQAEKDKVEIEKLEAILGDKNDATLAELSEEEIKKRIAKLKNR